MNHDLVTVHHIKGVEAITALTRDLGTTCDASLTPTAPGFSATLRPESPRTYQYPGGAAWTATAELADGRTEGD